MGDIRYPLARRVQEPGELKKLDPAELPALAAEIRQIIIEVVSRNGGHLASNLGVVELTIALHRVLDFEKDALIWDVGHQCYAHKILTGRLDEFRRLRTRGGISGFPCPAESPADLFLTGHSSTSIATAIGLACGGGRRRVVAVIGDASLGGGVAFEGLNKAAETGADLCVILNANEMAISPTIGSVAQTISDITANPHLDSLRRQTRDLIRKVPILGDETVSLLHGMDEGVRNLLGPASFFGAFRFRYFGPFDGHRFRLAGTLEKILGLEGPKLVHVVTTKGRGYGPAEEKPREFHSTGPFSPSSGRKKGPGENGYRDTFERHLVERGRSDPDLVAVTAAMPDGSGVAGFGNAFPDRLYDVGMAEQAAPAFAAGLAKAGRHPVVSIYATFFQRAYDQFFQEICLQPLPSLFVLPNAGLAGEDGPTHHGVFCLSFLRSMPGIEVFAPFSYDRLRQDLDRAFLFRRPTVILFPRDNGPEELEPIETPGARLLVAACGSSAVHARAAVARLAAKGKRVSFLPVSGIKPLEPALVEAAAGVEKVITVEENSVMGGFGSAFLEMLAEKGLARKVELAGLPDRFVTFGSRAELLAETGLDEEGIYRRAVNSTGGRAKR